MDNLYVPLQFRFPDGLYTYVCSSCLCFYDGRSSPVSCTGERKRKEHIEKDAGKTLILIL